jgi:hypothetical protein
MLLGANSKDWTAQPLASDQVFEHPVRSVSDSLASAPPAP